MAILQRSDNIQRGDVVIITAEVRTASVIEVDWYHGTVRVLYEDDGLAADGGMEGVYRLDELSIGEID